MDSIKSNNENYIIPARIRQARLARGLSLADLSNKIGVTSQAISQYEIGNSKPSMLVLKKIVDILDFPLEFFRKPINTRNSSKSAVFFRSRITTPKKIKEAFALRIDFINEIVHELEKYVDFPKLNIPDFSDLAINNESDNYIIEDIALRLREFWNVGLGPIDDLTELLQQNGFIVTRMQFDNRKVDAFSGWESGKPYIFLGSDNNSAVRTRFSIAHELGHLIMHTSATQDDIRSRAINDRMEEQANYFAGAFLLPEDSFQKEVVSSSINHYLMIKPYWRVSVASMIYRANNLNLLTENQLRYLKSQMTSKKYWRNEPYDDEIEFEKPDVIKEAIDLILDNDILTKKQLVRKLGYSSNELESLCFLPSGYFTCNDVALKRVNLKVIK